MGVDMRPRWVRQEKPSSSKVNKRRRAVGGCTCCTKELFPADWARFLLPWLLVLGFAALFLWVRGFGWLLSSLSGTAKFTATFFSEWSFVLSWSLCVWSLAVVHYASPGFIPLALTARSVAIDLLEPRVTAAKDFHWELKAYGPRVGELRTCKRNPAVQLTPFGSKKAMRICPVKPDRAHFCFFTGRTVLEMDHYCPWLGNCIGYGTRKPFLLSLWHGLCMGSSLFSAVAWDVVLAVSALPRAVAALPLFAVLVLGLFVMAILGVFFGYHFGLAASNYTTIENHERRLAPRTQKVPSKLDVRTAFANQDSFGDAVRRTFPSSNPRKASLFVVFWREWAYTPSPWDHGTLSNLTHYFGAFLTWGMPIYLGIKQWQPWDVSMVPASHGADLTMAGGKLVQQDAPLEPVGVTVQSLTPRSALVSAAELLTTGRG